MVIEEERASENQKKKKKRLFSDLWPLRDGADDWMNSLISLSRLEGELEEPCDDDEDDAMLLAVRSVCAPCGQARTRASRVSRELCEECSTDCVLIGSYLVVTSPILLCILIERFFSLFHQFLGVCLVLCSPVTVVAVTPVAGEMGFELVAWNKVFAGVNHLYQSCTYQKDKKSLLWSVFPANMVGLPILFALFTV